VTGGIDEQDDTVLYCPKCDRELDPGEDYCPVDHSIGGGVRGVTRDAIEGTPRGKRHMLGLTINDAYVVNGFLGSGGFGAVYRAEQKALARDVALKLLVVDAVHDPAVIKRFKREARTAAQLLDPNIVPLFDYGEATITEKDEEKVLFFAMELVHGPTLRQLVKGSGGLPLDDALEIGINILRGLAAAHQLGVVHRDLKPGNVLIDLSKRRQNFARLFDFGIASLAGSGGHTTQMSQGGVLGTPKYMAPEQWRAKQTAPCTDVYAFGVIFCEALTGKPPIPKMELVEMAKAHCKGPRPEITETQTGDAVPLALTRFIQRCMAIDPRQRYGTAREALEVLEAIDTQRHRAHVPEVSRYGEPGLNRDTDPSASQISGHMAGRIPITSAPPPLPPQVSGEHAPVRPTATDPEVDSDVIHVEFEEPRRLWPWALALVGLLLAFVGYRLIDALSVREAPIAAAVAPPAPKPAPPVAAKAPDAAIAVVAKPPDAAVVVAEAPDAEPPKPVPLRRRRASTTRKRTPTPPPPVERPKPKRIAGLDVTPKANPTDTDRAAALRDYEDGLDAQRRGAPKSAQRFFVRALKKGLGGPKAAEAQRRIKQIADATALEASEF